MSPTTVMYDDADWRLIPPDAQAVALYIDGAYANAGRRRNFRHATNVLTIAVSADDDADGLDIERGDATPAQAPGWVRRQIARGVFRPVLYASRDVMPSVVAALIADGIPLTSVRLWSAHYGIGPHICSPRSCGASFTANACQWTDTADQCSLDESLLDGAFWAPRPHPITARVHPKVRGATAGAALAGGLAATLRALGVHLDPAEVTAISTLATLIAGTITPVKVK